MRNLLSLLALALVLPFAACASEPEVEEVVEPEVVTVDPIEEPMAADVTPEGTVEAVQSAGGVLELAPGAAVENIDGWIATLSGNPDFAPVVDDLEALKAELTSADGIDGAAVGALLVNLGSATSGAAGDNESLQALGSALSSAGETLTGM